MPPAVRAVPRMAKAGTEQLAAKKRQVAAVARVTEAWAGGGADGAGCGGESWATAAVSTEMGSGVASGSRNRAARERFPAARSRLASIASAGAPRAAALRHVRQRRDALARARATSWRPTDRRRMATSSGHSSNARSSSSGHRSRAVVTCPGHAPRPLSRPLGRPEQCPPVAPRNAVSRWSLVPSRRYSARSRCHQHHGATQAVSRPPSIWSMRRA